MGSTDPMVKNTHVRGARLFYLFMHVRQSLQLDAKQSRNSIHQQKHNFTSGQFQQR